MKKAIIGIVAIIVIITLVAVGFSGVGSSEYWPTKVEFGEWREEIIVEFEDGSSESLKIMLEKAALFDVLYGGKAIKGVTWIISATATGEGFTKAVVDCTNIKTDWRILKGTTTKSQGIFPPNYGLVDVYVDQSAMNINSGTLNVKTVMDDNPSLYPAGSYFLLFSPAGTVEYWGEPQGEPKDKETAPLPPPRSMGVAVTRTPTGWILITTSTRLTPQYE